MADGPRATQRALLDAAEKLDAALAAYQRAAHGFLKLKLDSRKNVARAAEGLAEISRIDQELSAEVGRLVAAIAQVRDGQQATAEAVQQRALEVLERQGAIEELLARLEGLAAEVREFGGSVPDDRPLTTDELDTFLQRIGDLSDGAHAFATEAQALGFDDLAAEGQLLRQQLLSVKNRTARMERRTPHA
jgi:methyl-accepting chemotaxis protein